jgi:hypothetical protein
MIEVQQPMTSSRPTRAIRSRHTTRRHKTMSQRLPALATLSVLLFATRSASAAEPADPVQQDVHEQIHIMERSVTESSVTDLYSDEQRDAKLDLLDRARARADQGDIDGAMELVDRAGRMLYPMQSSGAAPEGEKRVEWLEKVEKVMGAILPAAYEIAMEKGAGTAKLDEVARQYEQGRAARADGDIDRAETLLIDAYNILQLEVASLRSGDRLSVTLPESGTREAWEEAEQSYLDWRFTADWMEQSAAALGADPDLIATGSRLAEKFYQEAKAHAAGQRWDKAVVAVDRAYAVMEEYWRAAGIDI